MLDAHQVRHAAPAREGALFDKARVFQTGNGPARDTRAADLARGVDEQAHLRQSRPASGWQAASRMLAAIRSYR